jgi:hypothetical protein
VQSGVEVDHIRMFAGHCHSILRNNFKINDHLRVHLVVVRTLS